MILTNVVSVLSNMSSLVINNAASATPRPSLVEMYLHVMDWTALRLLMSQADMKSTATYNSSGALLYWTTNTILKLA